ncbi:MAG: hypothetical protein HOI55_03670 [Candidatus Marinimicrobia bacterium]|jgi:protein involved in polysaccharide export with SLBB domain|nr:hypothetical protein [Candidatus Neomarinimicrobiota bacterium]MBT7900243.1 hypothetical protein [Candidatus Neomarinimicrobiota bacterium]
MKNILTILLLSSGLLLSQTADQIQQAKSVIKRTGMSESQVKSAAKDRGYSDQQINAAIQKEKASKSTSVQPTPDLIEKVDAPDLGVSNDVDQGDEIKEPATFEDAELPIIEDEMMEIEEESSLEVESEAQPFTKALTYFGYDIFKRDPALFQASSVGAVDPEYLIGPGDEIIVMLWGETQFRQVMSVDREGFVFIPEVGQVFVNGLNLSLLESKLFRVLSQSYASLNPEGRRPTTFLDVSLGNLRPLRIQVLGEVAQPGAYTVSPSATLFSALYYFNGPTTLGSLRDIHLIRGGKKIASIDFYDYLLTGKKPKDQKLQLDDVIFIPKRGKTVSIQGEVTRNAIFEIKGKEKFNDLLAMAGGLKNTAYLDRAQIDRIVPFNERTDSWNDRVLEDFNLGMILKDDRPLKLRDSDAIQIFSIMDMHRNDIYIVGTSISRPGRYELSPGMRIADLIQEAGGVLGDVYLEKCDIIRTRNQDLRQKQISIHLGKALEGDPIHNIELNWMDRVRVYGYSEMIPVYNITLNGHVKTPGRYRLYENMTLYDLLFKYGGFMDEEFKKRTYLKRAELVRFKKESDEKEIISFDLGLVLKKDGIANLKLQTYDAIRIFSLTEIKGETQYVSISGHVKRPGRYELFENNMTVYDILFKSGGFDDPLYRSQTFLNRADLYRFDKDRITQTISSFNLGKVLSGKNHQENFTLLPGDEIKVYAETIFNSVRQVSINGVVRTPGSYSLKTNMTLKDLILEAGGLNFDVYRYKVEVARIDPSNNSLNEYAKKITFDMDEKFSVSNIASDGAPISDITDSFELNAYDVVSVRPDPFFTKQRNVNISGMVLYPGDYTILSHDEKITDIIERAGGLRPEAYPDGSQFIRAEKTIKLSFTEIIKKPDSKLNFNVQGGDEIIITPHPNLVAIQGEVNNPGLRKHVSGKNVKYYVNISAGLNLDADRENIWVQYPNGDSKKWRRFSLLSPKVMDGSIIVVGKKPEEEPLDRTEFAKEIAAIFADFAQVIALILIANK